jgi:hypothetical protein
MGKIKFNKELLDKCIIRDNATLIGEYEKINRESDINYKCKCGIESIKNFRMLFENSGAFCDDCGIKEIIKKRGETNVKKYGYVNPLQNEEIRKKGDETNLIKYGYKNPNLNEEIKDKRKKNNMKKYGVESPMQTIEVKKQI